jgi:hypothetical protein
VSGLNSSSSSEDEESIPQSPQIKQHANESNLSFSPFSPIPQNSSQFRDDSTPVRQGIDQTYTDLVRDVFQLKADLRLDSQRLKSLESQISELGNCSQRILAALVC